MTKPTIVTRIGKAAALTYEEQDANFTNLRDATISVTDGTNTHAFNLNDTITFTAGTNVTLSVNSTTGAITINASGGGTLGGTATSDIDLHGFVLKDTTSWVELQSSLGVQAGSFYLDEVNNTILFANSTANATLSAYSNLSLTTLTTSHITMSTNHVILPKPSTSVTTTTAGALYYSTGSNTIKWYNGTAWADLNYTLPTATTSTLGGVKVDGSTVTISGGVISSTTDANSLTGSTLKSTVVNSSLTSVGTLSSLTVTGTVHAQTPYVGRLNWNSAIDTELTVDNYRFRVDSSTGIYPQIISNTGSTVNTAWTAVACLNGASIVQMGNTGILLPSGSWTSLYTAHGMDASGDTITVTLQDKGAGKIYRVTFMRSDAGSTGYNIIVERLL